MASAAAEALLIRDPREVIDALMDMLRSPVAFRIIPGKEGVVGGLQVEGRAFNLERFYVLRREYNPRFELTANAEPATPAIVVPRLGAGHPNPCPRVVADYGSARRSWPSGRQDWGRGHSSTSTRPARAG